MAVQSIKVYVNVTHQGQGLPKRASGPFPSGYVPKLDTSAELNDKDSSFYQLQISILCLTRSAHPYVHTYSVYPFVSFTHYLFLLEEDRLQEDTVLMSSLYMLSLPTVE
jgi:hypothetical protein